MGEDGGRARGIIAVLAVTALVALTIILVFFPPPTASEKILLIVVGALIAFCADVKQFYFGSSSGSKTLAQAQTDTVNKLTDAVATSQPVIVSPPDERIKAPPPSAGAAPDAEFVAFAKMVHDLNPAATDADIARAWAGLKGTDIPT